jgi:hypothetical protein
MAGGRVDFRVRTAFGSVGIEIYPSDSVGDAAREASLRDLGRLVHGFKYGDRDARRVVLDIHAKLMGRLSGAARGEFDFDMGSARADVIGAELRDAVQMGQLLLRRDETRRVVVPIEEPSEDALGPEAEPTAWIEIELLDEGGEPVANADYRIECDDGRVRTGTTNGWGKAREEGLHDGHCKVTFPRFHGPDWKAA